MNLIDILIIYGFYESIKTKLVRHKSSNYDLNRLFVNDQIEVYQSFQKRSVFSNCQQIISFIGEEGSRSKFIGVFKVLQERRVLDYTWPEDYLFPEILTGEFGLTLRVYDGRAFTEDDNSISQILKKKSTG